MAWLGLPESASRQSINEKTMCPSRLYLFFLASFLFRFAQPQLGFSYGSAEIIIANERALVQGFRRPLRQNAKCRTPRTSHLQRKSTRGCPVPNRSLLYTIGRTYMRNLPVK